MTHNEKPTTSRKAKQISMLEHAKKKSMWSGSKNSQTIESYVLGKDEDNNTIFELKDLKYPPALLKIIDEVIVNAIDHHTHYPKQVTEIKICVDKTGSITVYNNGPGIPVEKTQNLNGVEMYTPQLIASEFLAGDNLDDDGSNTKGGTNGIGLKLAAAFSTELTLETADSVSKLHYTQKFLNGLTEIKPPTIVPMGKLTKPCTSIVFTPDYKEFKLDSEKFFPTLKKILQTRSWQAAAYTKAKVYFNDELIPIKSFEDFCQMFSENEVLHTTMTQPNGMHDWDICLSVSDGKERHLSIVNGVYIPKGGTHIKYIQDQLIQNLRVNVEKELKKSGVKFNKNYITNNVFVFMKGAIPSPEFMSQTKEAISDPIEKFAGYTIPDSQWKKIWDLLEPAIMATFLKKQLGDVKTRANRGKVDVPKYKEARFCRDAKKCHQCGLIITEGDSATGTADTGLLKKKKTSTFTYDWFGVYGIQGVMMNGLKESREIKKTKKKGKKETAVDITAVVKKGSKTKGSKTTDDIEKKSTKTTKSKKTTKATKDDSDIPPKRIPNKKILENERIASLIKVLGLDFNKTYAQNEIGEKEWKTLRYGYIVGLTDQDLDGFNIFGLLATFIMTYWPALIERNFLRRINTPIVRAYPKNKKEIVLEFYSEREVKEWLEEPSTNVKKYTIKYYKGLGSHKEAFKEVTQMFKNIDTKICTYTLDDVALNRMYVYYGEDTKPRKEALSTPVSREPIDGLEIPISQHFEVDTKLYQRDNIIRKLLSCIDGFVTSRRKVFFVARKNGHKEIKVAGLASMAVKDANYHHGEASLMDTITRMAQGYPTARNLPLLQPLGNFGTRGKGYKDYAAPRYTFTMINWRLADKLFRREDDYILEYELEDGERYEPKYYVPIIPYVLCETNELPATGWSISVQARDIKAIFKNLRAMINGTIKTCAKLPMWKKDFKGTVRKYKNRNYYCGVYSYDQDTRTVHISELPPSIYSDAYLRGVNGDKKKKKEEEKKGIQSKEWVEDFEDNTTLESVDIDIILKPGAYEAISADDSKYGNEVFDCFEDYFELKRPIYDRINLVNEKGEVVEYKSYEAVFNDWYEFRKRLYKIRVEREIILTDLEIKMLKNQQKFSIEHDKYKITNKTPDEEAIKILKKNKYDIFNSVILNNPKFTAVQELIELITLAKNGADYEYILKLSYRDLTETAYMKRQERINELEDRMKYLTDETGLFPGAKIWLLELDELEASIDAGLKSNWFYGENEVNFGNDDDDD